MLNFSSFSHHFVLYYTYLSFILFFIFRLFENIFHLRALVLWNLVLNVLRVWNKLSYCGTLCYIFARVERDIVFWNIVLYFPSCGTLSGIVEFCVIFSRMWNALWYYGI